MNDLVRHNVAWPPIPIKLPSYILKLEGKTSEDKGAHITTFHLWCSSNSLNDDSIWLRLFQRTLTNIEAKWYIELPSTFCDSFIYLETVFLNHYQLMVWYDARTDLLSTFR